MKIEWLVNNYPSMSIILQALDHMNRLVNDINSAFLEYCAKQVVQEFMLGYYGTAFISKRQRAATETGLVADEDPASSGELATYGQSIADGSTSTVMRSSSLDLAYVFFYKNRMESMVNKIRKFSQKNLMLMDLIREKSNDASPISRIVND